MLKTYLKNKLQPCSRARPVIEFSTMVCADFVKMCDHMENNRTNRPTQPILNKLRAWSKTCQFTKVSQNMLKIVNEKDSPKFT